MGEIKGMKKTAFNKLMRYPYKRGNRYYRAGFDAVYRYGNMLYICDAFSVIEITAFELLKDEGAQQWRIINDSCMPAVTESSYADLEIACSISVPSEAQSMMISRLENSGAGYFTRFFKNEIGIFPKYDAARVKRIMGIFAALDVPASFIQDAETDQTIFWGTARNYDIRAILMPLR